jgi:ubiquinone/menaquinone biosynthesis C-methylase UbiE
MSLPALVPTPFIHPVTKEPLFRTRDGILVHPAEPQSPVCPESGAIYDFASLTDTCGDRAHYDGVYGKPAPWVPPVSLRDAARPWQASADLQLLLASLGGLDGKTVLLLGNGVSLKELCFLSLGARCLYTDLSVSAVRAVREAFLASEWAGAFRDRIEFHAVDALHLPFADASFDIVYGCAFVHHLADLDTFFTQVSRVLKRDGYCRFLDDAYSPIWHFLKKTLLRPLQWYSHWKHGISPADLAATRKGGFTRPQIERIAREHGFREVLFERRFFFEYFCTRGVAKLGGRFLLPFLRPLCRGTDSLLDRCGFIQRHGIRLVWGFRK